MKTFASTVVGFSVLAAASTFAAAPVSVPPDKMLAICGSLPKYAQLAMHTKADGVPLDKAVAMTQDAMKQQLTGLDPEQMTRYQAVIQDLFSRVYASPDAGNPDVYDEVNSACSLYAPGQYSQEDLRSLGGCRIQVLPYSRFADDRDKGVSLDDELKSLKREIDAMDKYTEQQRSQLNSDLSGKVRYVYAHRSLSGGRLYSDKLSACFEAAKKTDAGH